jgi:serine O-acetyltransferase
MLKQSLSKTLFLIRSDMQYRCDYEHKQLTWLRMIGFMLNHAVMTQLLYRWQIFFYTHHMQWIASLIASINSIVFTVSIDSNTNIGAGFLILHANYIHIGKNVTLGERCILAHQNSIGPAFTLEAVEVGATSSELNRGPHIGDEVLFGVGCAVFGDITIGSYSKVGINSAVDKSFPEYSMLVGVPAKNFNLAESKPT